MVGMREDWQQGIHLTVSMGINKILMSPRREPELLDELTTSLTDIFETYLDEFIENVSNPRAFCTNHDEFHGNCEAKFKLNQNKLATS